MRLPAISPTSMKAEAAALIATRPTAKNLEWAVHRMQGPSRSAATAEERLACALRTAQEITDEDADFCRRIGQHGLELIREDCQAQERRAREHPDPLQRRLAGVRGLRHRPRPRLCGLRRRDSRPRLGGRDPPAQPGRRPDDLGTGPPRRAAHAHPRQRRRASHAARPGGHRVCRFRPHHCRRRRGQQDRHLSQGARGA